MNTFKNWREKAKILIKFGRLVGSVLGRLGESNIQGFSYIFSKNKKWFVRLFWIIILTISVYCHSWLIMSTVNTLKESQISFTPNTLYLDWKTMFPSVTVCELYQPQYTSNVMKSQYSDLIESSDFTRRRYLSDLMFVEGSCRGCEPCGELIPCNLDWKGIYDKVRRSCKDLLKSCAYEGEAFDCCNYFLPVDTEKGLCFSFNSYQSKSKLPKFMCDQKSGPGQLTFEAAAAVEVFVQSSEEVPSNVIENDQVFEMSTPGTTAEFLFSIIEVENAPAMREVEFRFRSCNFLHEKLNNFTMASYPVYSYSACVISCKTQIRLESCGCVHFVRALELMERQQTIMSSDICGDKCYPSCVESDISRIALIRYPNGGNSMKVIVKMLNLPTMRYSRELLRDMLDFVVALGSMSGLCFGASLLSIVEGVFLLLFRK